jgi:hypothetical protein
MLAIKRHNRTTPEPPRLIATKCNIMDNAAAGPNGKLRLPENIAVIGLGIIGSLTALAILQRAPPSCHVTVYEVRPAPATIGGALNISPNAHRVMAKLGVSPKRYGGVTPYVLFQNDQGKGIGVLKYGGEGDRWAEGYEGMRAQRNDIQVCSEALLLSI